MIYKKYIPLFWKFTFSIVVIVVLFGSINLYFIKYSTYKTYEQELTRHGLITGRIQAGQNVDYILYEDLISLNRNVIELKNSDSSVAYVFILNSDYQVMVHSFENFVSDDLIHFEITDTKSERVAFFREKETGRNIHDFSIPILDGELGLFRIGLYEDSYFSNLRSTTRIFFFMVILFLIFGLLGAFVFAYVITSPIKKIIKKSEYIKIDKREKTFVTTPEKIENKPILFFPDELTVLTNKFNQMIFRLYDTLTELNLTQKSLIQTEKMSSIGTLSSGIAHEINNPIAGIKNCLRRIENTPDNIEQHKKYIDLMKDAVTKIEIVVTRLLDFSRKHNLKFERMNFVNVIESVLLLSSYQLEKSQISIVKSFDITSMEIEGSKNHLEQVVLNLLINSIDSIMERKLDDPWVKGVIDLSLQKDKGYLIFVIGDNGIGIAPGKLKNMFDPFFTEKKIKQGTGLGLSVSYNIIQQHNGKIEASLKTTSGMEIAVHLPIKRKTI